MSTDFYLTYQDGSSLPWPSSKVVCVGQNYAAHVAEMGGTAVADPVIFMKPATALCPLSEPIRIPAFTRSLHHEVELAVVIGTELKDVAIDRVMSGVCGYALALDLTARDLQQQCKQRGHPWDLAKGFDGSCPISACIPATDIDDPQSLDLKLSVNGALRQNGNTSRMIHPIDQLISFISRYVTLLPGDIVLTGTPEGVGQLQSGDKVNCCLRNAHDLVIAECVCMKL